MLQTVLGYEADCQRLKQWLQGQSSTIAGFTPPGITVETIRAQLTEVEVSLSVYIHTQVVNTSNSVIPVRWETVTKW